MLTLSLLANVETGTGTGTGTGTEHKKILAPKAEAKSECKAKMTTEDASDR